MSLPETNKGKMHPIRLAAREVGNLAHACLGAGYSLRLIACLMDTKSYGVVYQSIISAEKGRGGVRGPTYRSDKVLLQTNAGHLLAPMAARGITPRRWCSAYCLELFALFDPAVYEMNEDVPVNELLREDFPEAFGLSVPPYEHAYKEMQGYEHISCRKKGLHLYRSGPTIIGVSRNNGKALSIACRVTGLQYQAERLKILLREGAAAALAWLPQKAGIGIPRNEGEKEILDMLKRKAAIEDTIDKLAALPREYLSDADRLARDQFKKSLLELGLTEEQIIRELKNCWWKKGLY